MALPVPSQRPLLVDGDAYNDQPMTASLLRRIAQWQHHAYTYDTWLAPADPLAPNPGTGAWAIGVDNVVTGNGTSNKKFLGLLYLRPPMSFARRLVVWVRSYVSAAGSAGAVLRFVSRQNGRWWDVPITNAYVSPASGWLSGYVAANPLDTLELWLVHNSTSDGTNVGAMGVSAWWEPLDGVRSDVTIESSLQGFSQHWYDTPGRPVDAHTLRWLVRKANQYAAHRPRMVLSKWWDGTAPTQPAGGGSSTWKSFYKVYVGDGVTTLEANVYGQGVGSAGFANVSVILDGVSQKAFSWTLGAAPAWYYPTVSAVRIQFAVTPGVHEIEIDVSAGSGASTPTTCAVWGVSVFEVATSGLTLAGADTVPAAFQTIRDDLLHSGAPIYGTTDYRGNKCGIGILIQNMYWLWARMALRHLVSDCRYNDGPTASGYALLAPAASYGDVMATYWLPQHVAAPPGASPGSNPGGLTRIYSQGVPLALGRPNPAAWTLETAGGRSVTFQATAWRTGGPGSKSSSGLQWQQYALDTYAGSDGATYIRIAGLSSGVTDAQNNNHVRAAGAIPGASPAKLP